MKQLKLNLLKKFYNKLKEVDLMTCFSNITDKERILLVNKSYRYINQFGRIVQILIRGNYYYYIYLNLYKFNRGKT